MALYQGGLGPENALTWEELREIMKHVIAGECPPDSDLEVNGCMWAGDCSVCWRYYLKRKGV